MGGRGGGGGGGGGNAEVAAALGKKQPKEWMQLRDDAPATDQELAGKGKPRQQQQQQQKKQRGDVDGNDERKRQRVDAPPTTQKAPPSAKPKPKPKEEEDEAVGDEPEDEPEDDDASDGSAPEQPSRNSMANEAEARPATAPRQVTPASQLAAELGTAVPGGGRRVIVVLEKACLEPVKTKSGRYELLNCDDHLSLHRQLGRDPADSRPDITHQMLLTLLDSPLNKAGLLTVYVHTAQGILIEVSPSVRFPRTYKRFAGLMVQLLHKMRIRAKEGSKTLLRVIKNPVSQYLPTNARKFSTSVRGTLVDAHEFVDHLDCDDTPVVFAFGAMAAGMVEPDYTETCLALSQYPMSGAYAVGRLLGAFERKWGVV